MDYSPSFAILIGGRIVKFTQRCLEDQTPLGTLPGWLSALLRGRGIDTEEKARAFLSPSLDQLHNPFRMQGMDRAVRLIRDAIERRIRILVYGDYDADGVCAAGILLETLREAGADATVRIPLRHTEGYGLNEEAVREMAPSCQMLITVDCGISNSREVALARELGMTVIVSDHHELPDTLPEADAVLNPLLGDYPYRRLCGAGVALKICQALLGMDAVQKRLDLAALATVADVVPLTGENRVIVREGLARMSATPRPGLQALIQAAGINPPLRSEHLAFRLGPRINAAGRLEDALQAVRLLTTGDEVEARELAAHLEENNRTRQQEEQAMLREALQQTENPAAFRENRVVIAQGEHWNSGLIGLVAGKLCERYHFPAIVLSVQEETAVGSCRSIPGVNIYQLLSRCGDLFLRFGGHAQAAGLTILTARIPELRRRLSLLIRQTCDEEAFLPVQEYDLALPFRELTLDHLDLLDRLEPTGFGNPPPVFLTPDARIVDMRRVGQDQSHLKLSLQDAENRWMNGIAFSMGDFADSGVTSADVLYQPSRNTYGGRVTVELMIQALRPATNGLRLPEEDTLFSTLLQEMSRTTSKKTEYGRLFPLEKDAVLAALRKPLGTLVLTRRKETALSLAEGTGAMLQSLRVSDPRGFSTVLCGWQAQELEDQWETVLLADGEAWPGEAEAVRARCPNADLKAAAPPDDWAARLLLSDEALRSLYIQLRKNASLSPDALASAAGLTRPQVLAGLQIFTELRLALWQPFPFRVTLLPPPPQKLATTDSPLVRFLRG